MLYIVSVTKAGSLNPTEIILCACMVLLSDTFLRANYLEPRDREQPCSEKPLRLLQPPGRDRLLVFMNELKSGVLLQPIRTHYINAGEYGGSIQCLNERC